MCVAAGFYRQAAGGAAGRNNDSAAADERAARQAAAINDLGTSAADGIADGRAAGQPLGATVGDRAAAVDAAAIDECTAACFNEPAARGTAARNELRTTTHDGPAGQATEAHSLRAAAADRVSDGRATRDRSTIRDGSPFARGLHGVARRCMQHVLARPFRRAEVANRYWKR